MKQQVRFKRTNGCKGYKDIAFRALKFLSSVGALSVIVATSYSFLISDIKLVYEKPYGRSYIFSLFNDSPADIIVEKFKISYPDQPVIAKTTKDIYAQPKDGGLEMPGGNINTVPIIELHELDGETISAKDTHKFRLPPLNSRNYLRLEAAIFDITYEVTPKNRLLSYIDRTLKFLTLRNKEESLRYIVVDNYWIPTRSKSPYEAIRIACRDNDMLSRGDLCTR